MLRVRDSITSVDMNVSYTSTKEKREAIERVINCVNLKHFNKMSKDILKPLFDVHSVYRYEYASQNFEFRRLRYNNIPISIEYCFEGRSCEHYVAILNGVITLVPQSWFR
jgi:hypothetical protein